MRQRKTTLCDKILWFEVDFTPGSEGATSNFIILQQKTTRPDGLAASKKSIFTALLGAALKATQLGLREVPTIPDNKRRETVARELRIFPYRGLQYMTCTEFLDRSPSQSGKSLLFVYKFPAISLQPPNCADITYGSPSPSLSLLVTGLCY